MAFTENISVFILSRVQSQKSKTESCCTVAHIKCSSIAETLTESSFVLPYHPKLADQGALYSRTSMAGTQKARLPGLFRTHFYVPSKNPIAADLG